MLKNTIIILNFTIVLMISLANPAMAQGQAEQMLKEGSRYQAIDDTSDRAADAYQQLIRTHPKSAEAEAAQFFLGAYYSKKFYIIENRSNVQDWGSMNRAEQELYAYIAKYPNGFYLADAYHTLALSALRRGYWDNAKKLWMQMREVAAKDRKVYIYRVTWSTYSDDVIKGYCDTVALSDVSVSMLDKRLSFAQLVSGLTNWARGQCRPTGVAK
jgi:hypothetical protein